MLLETGSPKARGRQGCVLSETRGEAFLASSPLLVFAAGLWGSSACRFIAPVSAGIFRGVMPVSLHTIPFCAYLFLGSNARFLKDTSQIRLDTHDDFVLT